METRKPLLFILMGVSFLALRDNNKFLPDWDKINTLRRGWSGAIEVPRTR